MHSKGRKKRKRKLRHRHWHRSISLIMHSNGRKKRKKNLRHRHWHRSISLIVHSNGRKKRKRKMKQEEQRWEERFGTSHRHRHRRGIVIDNLFLKKKPHQTRFLVWSISEVFQPCLNRTLSVQNSTFFHSNNPPQLFGSKANYCMIAWWNDSCSATIKNNNITTTTLVLKKKSNTIFN